MRNIAGTAVGEGRHGGVARRPLPAASLAWTRGQAKVPNGRWKTMTFWQLGAMTASRLIDGSINGERFLVNVEGFLHQPCG